MKRLIFVSLIGLLLCFNLFAQRKDTLNQWYYYQLSSKLLKDTNVIEVKLVQKYYSNGKIKSQRFFARYRDRYPKQFWLVGKDFLYYKNGNLESVGYTDLEEKVLSDSTYIYDKFGNLVQIQVFEKNKNKVYVRIISCFTDLLNNYWETWPEQYKTLVFENGKLKGEFPFRFFDGKRDLLDGEALFYKEDGSIEKKIIYKQGNEISSSK